MITFDKNNRIYIPFDQKRIEKEIEYYSFKPGNLSGKTTKNYIIKFFQQDTFYVVEKELCNDEKVYNKLLNNRVKYLNKSVEELTSEDILQGFKRSAMYYGYSHFNPLIAKWFYEKYNIKTCYDPCGGWGHRLLGSLDLDLYIYNDLSISTYENVIDIIDWIDAGCITSVYNEDASTFIPEEDFEAMFTCPPYFNLEHYECGDFETYEDYERLIDGMFDCFYKKETCKVFGMVIREDCLNDKWKRQVVERFDIKQKTSRHISGGKDHVNKEYLYVFKK